MLYVGGALKAFGRRLSLLLSIRDRFCFVFLLEVWCNKRTSSCLPRWPASGRRQGAEGGARRRSRNLSWNEPPSSVRHHFFQAALRQCATRIGQAATALQSAVNRERAIVKPDSSSLWFVPRHCPDDARGRRRGPEGAEGGETNNVREGCGAAGEAWARRGRFQNQNRGAG